MAVTNRAYRVRWQTVAGSTSWYVCTKVEYRDSALVLSSVTAGRYGDEDLDEPDISRDVVVPWHVIRGVVEVVAVNQP
jgi:hypothetical protein